MGAHIVLFKAQADGGGRLGQVAHTPTAEYSATFTPPHDGVMRVYADGADVTLTINAVEILVPVETIEYFGVFSGQEVVVAG